MLFLRIFTNKFRNYLNLPYDVRVELLQLLSRNPILKDGVSADLLHIELIEVNFLNFETSYITCTAIFHVPIAGNLLGVILIEHRIENRLIR